MLSMLLLASGSLRGQCKAGDPSGRYDGSAVSAQAGKLDVSLNLVCEKGAYTGTLDTPLGLYAVTSGSMQGNALTLLFSLNGSTVHVDATVTGTTISGTFSTADDKGPVELRRVGEVAPPSVHGAVTPQQWHEDLAFFAAQVTKLHPDVYANTPKARFDAAVAGLDAKLDHLNADEIYVGLDQIANLIGDGHTYVRFPPIMRTCRWI